MPAWAGGATLACAALACAAGQRDEPAVFDSSFLYRAPGQAEHVDLSVFAHASRVLPGPRSVTLRLNEQFVDVRVIEFVAVPGQEDAEPCLSVSALRELGVKVDAFAALASLKDDACGRTLQAIPSAQASYDEGANVLNVSIPQAALDRKARGAVAPDRWDAGTNAMWSSYRISYNRTRSSDGPFTYKNQTVYVNLRNGLNLGAWRLRGNGNYYTDDRTSRWDWADLYAERDIASWRGRLRMGDSATDGRVFESARFRGLQIRSDDGMLPDSQRGYAPVVRGVAASSAKVTIRQNGQVIYATFVPAGPFVIDDLYSTPGGGDLEVTVDELGGRSTQYLQPFSALPTMMREGVWNYNLMLGEHRHNNAATRPLMAQAALAYGLPLGLTAYGGWTMAQGGYQSGAAGVAANLRHLGAVSADLTGSRSRNAQGASITGSAARIQYAKSFPGSGTDFTLASYRYNSEGYRSLNDAARDRGEHPDRADFRRQHEYQLSVLQRMGGRASLSLNFYGIAYRNAPRNARYAQLGYSSTIGRIGYSVTFAQSVSAWRQRESTLMLNFSIPLAGNHTASYAFNRTDRQGSSHSVNLSGAMLDDYSLSYALQAGAARGAGAYNGATGYGSLSYAMPVGLATASHATSGGATNTYLDVSGAVLADGKGLLFGQSLGETAVIVEAPGAAGAVVDAMPGVRTNAAGRALVPYASPYRENRISLDAGAGLDGAHLKQNVQTVVPTRGAIVVAQFDTQLGRTLLAVLKNASGKVLPFGAAVYDAEGTQQGIVGPVGRAWLTGLQGTSRFTVKWGEQTDQQCSFEIDITQEQDAAPQAMELTCLS